MLTDALVDGLADVLTNALGETLFETLGEVLGDMLTNALVKTLADSVDSPLVAPNKKQTLASEFLFGNTYTGKLRSRPRLLRDKKIRQEKIVRCTAYMYLPEWKVLYWTITTYLNSYKLLNYFKQAWRN